MSLTKFNKTAAFKGGGLTLLEEQKMTLREYKTSDCKYIYKLFYNTVHSVNAKDYTQRQLDAWATGCANLEKWNSEFLQHYTLVAVENGIIVGFGDIDETGYLDRLYVHKDYQRRGIASAICSKLEKSVNTATVHTYSSITAAPFFLSRGYAVIKEQYASRGGVKLKNYLMEKKV